MREQWRRKVYGRDVRLICKIVVVVYGLLYVVALWLYLVYGWGLFGHQPEVLTGVYLAVLGWPWFDLIDLLPEVLWQWLGVLAPLGNLLVILLVCRLLRGRARPR